MSNTKYRITVAYDQDTEDPSEYDLFKVVSFNNRHGSYQDPDKWLPCRHEDDEGEVCDQMPWQHSYGDLANMGDYQTRYMSRPDHEAITDHEYLPDSDIIGVLSYFEHGQCVWGLEGTMYNMPDFRWDGSGVAGVLLYSEDRKEDRGWWDQLTDEERRTIMVGFLDQYTSWCNGENYWALFEKWVERDPNPCVTCGRPQATSDWEEIDSCGGLIGWDTVKEYAAEWASGEGITADDIEIVEDLR